MSWGSSLRSQILAEFRDAQRVRGAIVDRDTKPENHAHQEIVEIVNLQVSKPNVQRRIVRLA